MMYFAALGANDIGPLQFALTRTASYLDEAKIELLHQATGASTEDVVSWLNGGDFNPSLNTKRVNYPHKPITYYCFTCMLTEMHDNNESNLFK